MRGVPAPGRLLVLPAEHDGGPAPADDGARGLGLLRHGGFDGLEPGEQTGRRPGDFYRGRRQRRAGEFGGDGRRGLQGIDFHLHRPRCRGRRSQLERRGKDDAEAPEGSGEQAGEIVAGHVLHDDAAGLRHAAVDARHRHADDGVARRAVAMASRTAVVRGHDSADGRPLRPRRIPGEALAVHRQRGIDRRQRRPGLDRRGQVSVPMLDDAGERRGGEQQIDRSPRRAPVLLGAAAADPHREPLGRRRGECRGQRLAGRRQGHQARPDAVDSIFFAAGAHRGAGARGKLIEQGGRRRARHQTRSARPAASAGCFRYGPGTSPQRRGVGNTFPGLQM